VVSLADFELPAKLAQTFGQVGGLVKDFVNFKLPPVVKTAAQHRRLQFRQAVVDGGRSRITAGIHEEHAATWGKTGTDKLPKLREPLRRNVGKPESKKHNVELLARLPLE